MNNIFIERLWRWLRDEAVYLTELRHDMHASRVIKEWTGFYVTQRPHSALEPLSRRKHPWLGGQMRSQHEV